MQRRWLEKLLSEVVESAWTLSEIRPLGARSLEFRLRHEADSRDLGIEVSMRDDTIPAFSRGERYQASYRNGPSLLDIDSPLTSQAVRETAHQLCRLLAAQRDGPLIDWTPGEQAKRYPAGTAMETIAADLERALRKDWESKAIQNPEGWSIAAVRIFQRWVEVVEVIFERTENERIEQLAFILAPTDLARAAYRRSAQFDIVYYSDDLAVEDHHILFAKHQRTIERITGWFLRWDAH